MIIIIIIIIRTLYMIIYKLYSLLTLFGIYDPCSFRLLVVFSWLHFTGLPLLIPPISVSGILFSTPHWDRSQTLPNLSNSHQNALEKNVLIRAPAA